MNPYFYDQPPETPKKRRYRPYSEEQDLPPEEDGAYPAPSSGLDVPPQDPFRFRRRRPAPPFSGVSR